MSSEVDGLDPPANSEAIRQRISGVFSAYRALARESEVAKKDRAFGEVVDRMTDDFCRALLELRDWKVPLALPTLMERCCDGEVGLPEGDAKEVGLFFRSVTHLTGGFERGQERVKLLYGLADVLPTARIEVINALLQGQHRGELAEVPAETITQGLIQGLGGAIAPRFFFPFDLDPAGPAPGEQEALQRCYFLDALLRKDATRWFDQSVACGLMNACLLESARRTRAFPVSFGVLDVVASDSATALQHLYRRVSSRAHHVAAHDVDPESTLTETLAKELHDSDLWDIFYGAMEGRYEQIGASLARDVIDESRKGRAKRRTTVGGHVPSQLDDDEQAPLSDSAGFVRAGGTRVPIVARHGRELGDVDDRLLVDELRVLARGNPRLRRLLESHSRRPDLTLRERARLLGVTERTLHNWQEHLRAFCNSTN